MDLFIDGETLHSEEGTTEGDPLALAFFTLATVPLAEACKVDSLGEVWFADDAAGSGRLKLLRMW